MMDEFSKYVQKGMHALARQNSDPEIKERDYTQIIAILPVKALMEIYRRKLKEE